uniref:Uncharacterized protein n=1 Tax=Oryza glumipatula TaxID=40148 RepID=A0A0E0BK59_9ORYZ
MLGFSTGQLVVILGACSLMMKRSDMIKIARVAGRMTGRAVGRLMLFRRQMDEILEQTAAKQVNKELKDAMTQLDSIRYEVQNLSRFTPGQFMRQHNPVGMDPEAGKNDAIDGSALNLEELRHQIRSMVHDEIESFYRTNSDKFSGRLDNADTVNRSVSPVEGREVDEAGIPTMLASKDMKLANTGFTDLHSKATMYARLTESPEMSGSSGHQFEERDGLLNVLPISAESAGLLPSRSDKPQGSDLLLEATLEAEVAEHAKSFAQQHHDELRKERENGRSDLTPFRTNGSDPTPPLSATPHYTTQGKKRKTKNPIRIRLIPSSTLSRTKNLTMSPVTALLAGAAAPLPPPRAMVASRRPFRVTPAGYSPVGGGCALAVECSSRPQKKATKHHMKTRPKKSQPWDRNRRPTQYPPLPPLPPDWTLVAAGATVDAAAAQADEPEPEPVAAPVVEVVAAPSAAD